MLGENSINPVTLDFSQNCTAFMVERIVYFICFGLFYVCLLQFLKYYRFLTEVLIPIVKTEFQLLYVYHLVGPFLQRFQQERTRCMLEVGYWQQIAAFISTVFIQGRHQAFKLCRIFPVGNGILSKLQGCFPVLQK